MRHSRIVGPHPRGSSRLPQSFVIGLHAEPTAIASERGRERALHGHPSGTPGEQLRWLRRWVIIVLTVFAAALFPWTLYLSYTLPAHHVTPHWDVAWAGFDLLEAAAAIATVIALFRKSGRLPMIAAAAGTLLICDAWFDVVTARAGSERAWAVAGALATELPLAALCLWVANDAQRLGARAR